MRRMHTTTAQTKATKRQEPKDDDDCRPSNGHTYLTIGQDLFSIQDYVNELYNYTLHEYSNHTAEMNRHLHNNDNDTHQKHDETAAEVLPPPPTKSSILPAAFMVYTNIQELQGLDQPTDYGSGIEYANGLVDLLVGGGETTTVAGTGLQVGLWLGGSAGCQDVVDGILDSNLQQLYQYLIDCPFPKVFLRVGYEFDNPEFGYTDNPAVFVQAFQTIVRGCTGVCREKTLFVWHSWAAGLPLNQSLADYYPGHAYVDWIGVSVFQQFYPDSQLGNRETLQQVLDFAVTTATMTEKDDARLLHQHHHNHHHDPKSNPPPNDLSSSSSKPVMIAESTPFRGIDQLDDPWMDWFVPVLDLIEENDISMWSYINCDWDRQPLWHGVGFGNTRLASNATVLKLWYQHVFSNPRFLPHHRHRDQDHHHNHHHHSDDDDDGDVRDESFFSMLSSLSFISSGPHRYHRPSIHISSKAHRYHHPHLQLLQQPTPEQQQQHRPTFFFTSRTHRHNNEDANAGDSDADADFSRSYNFRDRVVSHFQIRHLLGHLWFVLLLFGLCLGCCLFCCYSHQKIKTYWKQEIVARRSLSIIPEGKWDEEEEEEEDDDDDDDDKKEDEQVPLVSTNGNHNHKSRYGAT